MAEVCQRVGEMAHQLLADAATTHLREHMQRVEQGDVAITAHADSEADETGTRVGSLGDEHDVVRSGDVLADCGCLRSRVEERLQDLVGHQTGVRGGPSGDLDRGDRGGIGSRRRADGDVDGCAHGVNVAGHYRAGIEITRITVFRQWQPFVDGVYTCSGGRSAEGFDSTIVRIDTDAGLVGWGEMAPLGTFYDPSFAAGAREGLRVLAPVLIGLDPRHVDVVGQVLDLHLNGHPYAKSALDMACWDLTARAAELPLAEALGGRHASDIALYRSVAQDSPSRMAAKAATYVADGYRRIQVKVGLDPHDDIERMHAVLDVLPPQTVVYADANAAWLPAQARTFVRATRDLDYTLEQPCASHDANLSVRAMCDRPFVLDESIDSLPALLRAHGDGLVDGITVKIARVGGITKARRIRDVAAELGLQVTIEDTGGAQIDTAAIAHMSLSTPLAAMTHTVDFHNWVTVANGVADLDCSGGRMRAPSGHGLGVAVDDSQFGEPLFVCG